MKASELKAMYLTYKANKAYSDNILALCEDEPDNEMLDNMSDEAYENMWASLETFASALVEYTGGAVDLMTAKRMTVNIKYADKLAAIMDKVA